MNLEELINKYSLEEGDEVLCVGTDIDTLIEGDKYTLARTPSGSSERLYIITGGMSWCGDSSEFEKIDKVWSGKGLPNFGDKLRVNKKELSFVGINSLGSWVLETEDGELKGFHSKDVKVVLNEKEIAISACTLDLLNIACSLEYRQDWESLAEGLYKEGYRKESK